MTEVENQFEKINSVKVIIENKEGKILLIQEEVGIEIEPLGFYKIEEVLHDDKTVMMYIAIARMIFGQEVKGKINAYKWVGIEDVENMYTSEFTAFYAKKLILDYLSGNREFLPFDIVETQQYYDLDQDPEFQKWLESGKKKS